jgi:Holliday junction resolvase RusA-like endonuclease
VIFGRPATKKNSPRVFARGKRIVVLPSAASCDWTELAVMQLRQQWQWAALERPVSLNAQIFRERRFGDLGNYLNAICDALETAGVVENDKWILSFDGSRLRHDRENPRVEIELSELTDS